MGPTTKTYANASKVLRDGIRRAYPYMKTATLDGMIGEALSIIEKRIKESQPDQAAAKARTSFFSLPAELRNTIYEMYFDTNVTYETRINLHVHSGSVQLFRTLQLPTVVQVSRTVRAETLAMYYSNRTFTWSFGSRSVPFKRRNVLVDWLDGIGHTQASMIKKLVIKMHIDCTELEAKTRKTRGKKKKKSGYQRDIFVGDFFRAIGLGKYGIQSIVLRYRDVEDKWVERTEGLLLEAFANSGLPDQVFDGDGGWDGILLGNNATHIAPVDSIAESGL